MLIPAALAFCAVLSPAQDAPELLPPMRPGWSFERLELPLSFAPDLPYEGFEELAFAPGMFDPASDTYFSYALAFRLEGDVDLDEEALRALLVEYYRGLCEAVARGRGLELDLAGIDAHVRREGERFRATVETVDPFATLGPLTLELELERLPVPRATLLLGLASPMPPDGPAWEALRELRAEWRAAHPAPVLLNHVYVAPDAETYAALRDSELLRELALVEERTTTRADATYTGTYVYGERTYFELLRPGDSPSLEPGACGVALGLEEPGGTARRAEALAERGIETFPGAITRELAGAELPWFRILGVAMPETRLSLFAMEYDPRFLERWHAGASPAAGIGRRAVLARYRAVLDGPSRPRLGDVVEVELELDTAERGRFLELAETFAWSIGPPDAAGARTVDAPEVRYVLRETEGPARIASLRLRLTEPLEREPLELGRARLELDGETATLRLP